MIVKSSLESMAEVRKILDEIAQNGGDAFTFEEISALKNLMNLIKDSKVEGVIDNTIVKNVFSGLGD